MVILVRGFIAVKRHHDHCDSYREKISWDGSLTVSEVLSTVIMSSSMGHDAEPESVTDCRQQEVD